jgi:hypothetical protein
MPAKLKSCPFCESKETVFNGSVCIEHDESCFVLSLGFCDFGKTWLTNDADIAAWNTRAGQGEEKILQSASPTNSAREAITCTNVSCGWNIRGKGFCGLIRCCPGRNK